MVTALGRVALSLFQYFGELALLVSETCVSLVVAPIRWRLFARQIVEVGWRSQFVVIVTGMFTGAVLTQVDPCDVSLPGVDRKLSRRAVSGAMRNALSFLR